MDFHTSPAVTNKMGVTPHQAQRIQALLRLGVTGDDVRVAERLMGSGSRSDGPNKGVKLEWLLGRSIEEMSKLKALEVLGISSAMLEEEKEKILGSLGVKSWGTPGNSTAANMDEDAGPHRGPIFSKRRHISPGVSGVCTSMCEVAAPAQEQMGVAELEDECLSQHLRIQQLELQVAALTKSSCSEK